MVRRMILSRNLIPVLLHGLLALLFLPLSGAATDAPQNMDQSVNWRIEEVSRFHAPQATQGVAVGPDHLYAIGTLSVAKYDRKSLELQAEWSSERGGPIVHFNAGFVLGNQLVVAHSNYPEIPMTGSVEWFDTETLQPSGTHSFGAYFGSVTWVLRHEEAWWVCFAHYGNRAAEPNRDPNWTSLVRFDDQWRRTGGWVFPSELMAHLGGQFTLSGGGFGPEGFLYVTGHDEPEMYVLRMPKQGSVLEWISTLSIPAEGQAFAWDPTESNTFFCIVRSTREIVKCRLITD